MSTEPKQNFEHDKRQRVLSIIWAAFLVTIANLFFITLLVPRSGRPASEAQTLILVLAVLALALIGLSFLFKRKILTRAATEQRPQMVMTAYILALAMCDAACIMGVLVFFTTDFRYYFLWFIAGALAMILHRPRRDDLLAASYRTK
jgi:Kef-type K+ transport system membrane component KefB